MYCIPQIVISKIRNQNRKLIHHTNLILENKLLQPNLKNSLSNNPLIKINYSTWLSTLTIKKIVGVGSRGTKIILLNIYVWIKIVIIELAVHIAVFRVIKIILKYKYNNAYKI